MEQTYIKTIRESGKAVAAAGLVSLATLAMTLSASPALADDLNDCVKAAVFGPEKKGVDILDHGFNCKPVVRVNVGEGVTKVTGQLSHRLNWRADDQVYYEFVIDNGKLQPDSIKRSINRGGYGALAGAAGSAIGAYFGVPVSAETATEYWRKGAKVAEGDSWEQVTDLIIGTVALSVSHHKGQDRSSTAAAARVRDHRTSDKQPN
jgi:hypothetical protein